MDWVLPASKTNIPTLTTHNLSFREYSRVFLDICCICNHHQILNQLGPMVSPGGYPGPQREVGGHRCGAGLEDLEIGSIVGPPSRDNSNPNRSEHIRAMFFFFTWALMVEAIGQKKLSDVAVMIFHTNLARMRSAPSRACTRRRRPGDSAPATRAQPRTGMWLWELPRRGREPLEVQGFHSLKCLELVNLYNLYQFFSLFDLFL